MAHLTNDDVTNGAVSVPQVHAGLNYVNAKYTLAATASASNTIAMCRIPAGARIVDARLTISPNELDTTGAGNVAVQTWTGGNNNGEIVQTAAASTLGVGFNPVDGLNGYRHTSSSQAVVRLSAFAGTGSSSIQFNLSLTYDCQKEGD